MVLWFWVWVDLVWVVESDLGCRIGSGLWVDFGSLEWFYGRGCELIGVDLAYGPGLIDLLVGCCELCRGLMPWLIDWVIGCGFVVRAGLGGDIQWMVVGGG